MNLRNKKKFKFTRSTKINILISISILVILFSICSSIVNFLTLPSIQNPITKVQKICFIFGNLGIAGAAITLISETIRNKSDYEKTWLEKLVTISNKNLIVIFLICSAIFLNLLNFLINRQVTIILPEPIVVYQVDSYDNSITGTITYKRVIGDRYLLTINDKETYMVPKHVYDENEIGDDVPSYLNGK